jgi:hypothetical protein
VVHYYNPAIIKEKLIPWFSACWDKTICHLETGVLSLFFCILGEILHSDLCNSTRLYSFGWSCAEFNLYFQVCQHHVVMCKNSQAFCLHASCFSLKTDPVTQLTPIPSHSVCSDKNADHKHTHTSPSVVPLHTLQTLLSGNLFTNVEQTTTVSSLTPKPGWTNDWACDSPPPPNHRWCSRAWAYKLYLYMLFLLAHL